MQTYKVYFNNSVSTQEQRGKFIAEIKAENEIEAAKQLHLNKFYLKFIDKALKVTK